MAIKAVGDDRPTGWLVWQVMQRAYVDDIDSSSPFSSAMDCKEDRPDIGRRDLCHFGCACAQSQRGERTRGAKPVLSTGTPEFRYRRVRYETVSLSRGARNLRYRR
jgi:hypothetical protein